MERLLNLHPVFKIRLAPGAHSSQYGNMKNALDAVFALFIALMLASAERERERNPLALPTMTTARDAGYAHMNVL